MTGQPESEKRRGPIKWVEASGVQGARSIRIKLATPDDDAQATVDPNQCKSAQVMLGRIKMKKISVDNFEIVILTHPFIKIPEHIRIKLNR